MHHEIPPTDARRPSIIVGSRMASRIALVSALCFVAKSGTIASAFSTNRVGVSSSSCRSVPVCRATTGAAVADPTDTASKGKAAIIFLHGLGDSPDGWASYLPEVLPSRSDLISKLDITYVFPPAQMVGKSIIPCRGKRVIFRDAHIHLL